jgi:opacity protein-like surface antigen
MKKLLIALVIVFLVTPAFAGNWFISYQANSMNWEDDNIKEIPLLQAVETGYSWKNIELGVEGIYVKTTSDKGSSFNDNSLMATLKLKYPIKKFTPYAVFGIGEAWFKNKEMANIIKCKDKCKCSYYPETLPADTSIAIKSGLGLQYTITKNITIFTEGTYRYGNTGRGASLDVYGWSYGLGLKVYF